MCENLADSYRQEFKNQLRVCEDIFSVIIYSILRDIITIMYPWSGGIMKLLGSPWKCQRYTRTLAKAKKYDILVSPYSLIHDYYFNFLNI